MLCHQRTQLHSAYTVLDGGCCLIFSPPLLVVEIVLDLLAFRDQWVGLLLGRVSERTGEQEKHAWEGLCTYYLKRQMRRTCGFVRVWEECVPNGHHEDNYCILRSLWSLLSFIVFYQLKFFKTQWNVKYYGYLYAFVAFSCCLIWCECCVWLCVLFSCYHSLCENGTICRSLWGDGKWVEVSSEVDVMNVWQVPIESLCLKWFRMHFLSFVNQGEDWNKTEFD